MKIYWSTSSVPQLAFLPNSERKAVWRNSYKNGKIGEKCAWVCFSISLFLILAFAVLAELCGIRTIIGTSIGAVLGALINFQIVAREIEIFLSDLEGKKDES
jgi:hypothetical protein